MMRLNSLAFRLFASAAVWALVVLPVAAFLLVSLFENAVERSFDARLSTYLTTLIATTDVDESGRISEPPGLGDPVFSIPFSGWYWQVKIFRGAGQVVASSESLADEVLTPLSEQGVSVDENSVRTAYMDGPNEGHIKAVEREITFGDAENAVSYSFVVTGNAAEVEQDIADFTTTLASSLLLLGLGLVLATFFQVRFGLLPLRAIGEGLAAVRSGDAETLEGDFPQEIEPLQRELNALIQSNRDIIERARTHVGNLAHALKTPLSVMSNEAANSDGALAEKVKQQTVLMRDQISHHLDRARMAARVDLVGSVTEVAPVLNSLGRALTKIYGDKGIEIEINCPAEIKFQGEQQDLEEMVGNLLDNACKWAEQKVKVETNVFESGEAEGQSRLFVLIDDDGPGLSAEERALVVKRGQRLDETMPGSGLGLSIVADLAHLYKGDLTLEESPYGGLRARLELPRNEP